MRGTPLPDPGTNRADESVPPVSGGDDTRVRVPVSLSLSVVYSILNAEGVESVDTQWLTPDWAREEGRECRGRRNKNARKMQKITPFLPFRLDPAFKML